MKITTFDCPKCSAPLEVEPGKTTIQCKYCGNSVVIPEELRTGMIEDAPAPQFRQAPQVVINAPAYNPYRTSRGPGCAIGGIVAAVACLILVGALVPILGATALMANLESATGIDWDGNGSTSGGDPAAIFGEGVEIPGVGSSGYATQVRRFGSEGNGRGQFEDLRHIGVDNQGNIYTAEYLSNGRIQVFDSEGKFLSQWMLEDDDIPLTGMAVAPDGTVYITYNGSLTMHDGMTGEQLGVIADEPFTYYEPLELGADGSLYTWHWTEDDVIHLNNKGEELLRIPDPLAIADEPSMSMSALTVDGVGNIYFVTIFEPAVFIYDAQGRYQNRFGSEGDEPGQFTSPSDIAVDGQGRIYVLDFFGIEVYRNDGQYLDVIPTSGPTYGIQISGNLMYVAAMDHVE